MWVITLIMVALLNLGLSLQDLEVPVTPIQLTQILSDFDFNQLSVGFVQTFIPVNFKMEQFL